MHLSLHEHWLEVEKRIKQACKRSNRERSEVNVVAVTKYVGIEEVREVLRLGLTHIGENRWQDAQEKWALLQDQAVWHFIGHLQSNKVKDVVGRFPFIHSLDRMSLAKEINKKAAASGIQANCFIQINVSGEDTKHGLQPDMLESFAQELTDSMTNIHILGLMTMAPHEEDAEATRPVFRELRIMKDKLQKTNIFPYPINHLSMGMSNDYEVAIEEGSTWLRLGSIIFKGG